MSTSSKPSIFITGQNGFLGNSFSKSIQDRFVINSFSENLFEIPDDYLTGSDQFFFHFAGNSLPAFCESNPNEAYKNNVLLPAQLIEKFSGTLAKNKTAFVFFSTSHVYAKQNHEALNDDAYLDPKSPYARTKLAAEFYIRDLCSQFDIPYIMLRLFNTSHKTQTGPYFMPTIYQQIFNYLQSDRTTKFELKTGELNVVRDFLALPDFLTAMHAIVDTNPKDITSGIYNLSSGCGKNLYDITNDLLTTCGLTTVLKPTQDPMSYLVGNSTKFQSAFGWKPKYSNSVEDFVKGFLSEQ